MATKKPKSAQYTKQRMVRMTASDFVAIEKAALKRKLSISEWLRMAIAKELGSK